jgi:hypothetical protein
LTDFEIYAEDYAAGLKKEKQKAVECETLRLFICRALFDTEIFSGLKLRNAYNHLIY